MIHQLSFLRALPALLALAAVPVFAQTTEAAPVAAAVATDSVEIELDALIEAVGNKLRTGEQTAVTLSEELKQFDALLSKYAEQKTEAVARIALMKAMLFLQVFEDFEEGARQLQTLVANFGQTEIAAEVTGLLGEMEPMLAARKIGETLKVGGEFPTFAEVDLKGQPLDLAAYRGKVVLIDFWATWCGPCVAELPHVLAAYKKFHAKGFEIIGVSLDKDRARLDAFLEQHQMTWVQFFDGQGWENKLSRQYGISAIPATFLLDANGRIVARDLTGSELEDELAKLLP
ncbi:MAG: TlpA disulfide reductase family protein [Candidatus Didemnitutus sp.]|nr:TlpA disulfide reductase family protein [Candidatus Didemnitutus sp.]